MAIFDIEKDELLRLSDIQLEELVARLSEAEIAAFGHSPACVSWSGSINASDEGIDIHIQVPVGKLGTGFLEKPDTILQAKKHSMSRSMIMKEMVVHGKLSTTISNQAAKSGSYIIVSLADDCSPPMYRERLKSMHDAVKDDSNRERIHLDFYDRSRLTQWLRQHPSIMLWVKGKLGQGYSGWQPYGSWSNPPLGVTDKLIAAPGVAITLPSGKGQKLNIGDAIAPMRDLIRSTTKAVRITGLSGVGKTRIVQALFDETIGSNALDKTIAVYVDTGSEPTPSATAMLERLNAEGRRAIMVLDNCPSELHSLLASKVSASNGAVTLITVEYDIRDDDKPQTTEVIHIEAFGPEVAEQLLICRFPAIGKNNARRIAEFSDGNARVSLAIAERVKDCESLAQLSDAQLFNRLFEQRKNPDENLREQAEILSLVYSFSVSTSQGFHNELELLGSISGHSQAQLFRAAKKLMDRHIVQKRANWRAVLPHVIANKLAASALDCIPVAQIRDTFEASGSQRLLMSFAHRLGLMHDHPVAKEVVEAWLQPEGVLGRILELDEVKFRMLGYIGPVAPEALLERIESELIANEFCGMTPGTNTQRTTILNLLQLLAYEEYAFERCVRLLIRVADCEDEDNKNDSVRDKITRFFQAYFSGTHASLEQRVTIMNECLCSDMSKRRSLGFKMLSTALGGPPWYGLGPNQFGARPRDFGFQPNFDELLEWYSVFIGVAVRMGTSDDPELLWPARQCLAEAFRGLWHYDAIRDNLVDAAFKLHEYFPWNEGWKAVRTTIYFDYRKCEGKNDFELPPGNLTELERKLEPSNLVPKVMTYVLSSGNDYWALDADFSNADSNKYRESEKRLTAKAIRLGEDFALSTHKLEELGSNLFSSKWMPYRSAFGRGLARGERDLRIGWQRLIEQLEKQHERYKGFGVFGGYLEEVDSVDPRLSQELLDECAKHPELRQVLVDLHPQRQFTETDFDRCVELLEQPDTRPWMYRSLLWRSEYSHLPESRVLDLAQRLLNKPYGDDVVLDALSMKLHDKDKAIDTLGPSFRLVGLKAAIQKIQRNSSNSSDMAEHHLECVIYAVLRFDGNEAEKLEWLNSIFAVVDEHYGYIHGVESAVETTAELMTKEFLDQIFSGSDKQQHLRKFFIRNGGLRRPILSKVSVDRLIEWCCARNDHGVWASISAGIDVWSNDGEESVVILDPALRFLEAAPEPKAVIEAFIDRIAPSCWSGSKVDFMQPRVDAILGLIEHENTNIAMAAKSISAKLTNWLECEREREKLEDEEREQRFE
ncbi:TPA: hypothetical protein NJ330_001961 [Vibrio parahaemolyticus]|nr:hypothetical protein [Vibrio parahaemolyticus]